MALRLDELANTIDHTLLSPTAPLRDAERHCEEAMPTSRAVVEVVQGLVRLRQSS